MTCRYVVLFLLVITKLTSASFLLDQGLGLDGMQVGGAHTANPQSCSAIYWNPANLVNINQAQLYSSYSNSLTDASNTTFIYTTPLNENISIGFGYLGQQVSDIEYRGNIGQSLGANFNYSNNVSILALGYKLSPEVSLGTSAKLFSQKALSEKTYQSFDLSIKMQIQKETNLGFNAENFFNLNGQNEVYPKYRMGIEQQVSDWTLSSDFLYDALFNKTYLNYGFNYNGLSFIEIKGGINGYFERYFLGMSLKLENISLDYMFSDPELGASHSFGIGLKL